MDGKRILYAASSGRHLRSFHLPYIQALREQGYRVELLADCTAGGTEGLGEVHDLPFRKRFFSPGNLRTAFRTAKLVRKNAYDLVILNTSLAAFWVRAGILLRGCRRRPRVVNLVHGYLFDRHSGWLRRTVLTLAERLVRPVTDEVWVMNGEDAAFARSKKLYREVLAEIPGMGVNVDRFRFPERSAEACRAERAGTPVEGDGPVLVYVAELSARKRAGLLLEAAALLRKEFPELRLVLVGDGAEEAALRQKTAALGLDGAVWFAGQRRDPERFYRMADVYAAPSRMEGLPFNVMEAMAAGLPVVASAVKGHVDLLDGAGGVLVPLGGTAKATSEAASYADAIASLLRDGERRAFMGAHNVAAVEKYSFPAVFPQVLERMMD